MKHFLLTPGHSPCTSGRQTAVGMWSGMQGIGVPVGCVYVMSQIIFRVASTNPTSPPAQPQGITV